MKKGMYIDINEIMKDAVPDDTIKRAHEESLKYFNSEEFRKKEFERAAGVAKLMNQVVGAEML
jgi:hypothetical protein